MHVSENKYVTDSISNLLITERGVRSDEIIELAVEERTSGHLIDVIKPALNAGINAARTRDKAWASSIGVFVMYQNAGARA
jgi:hypothetical protein